MTSLISLDMGWFWDVLGLALGPNTYQQWCGSDQILGGLFILVCHGVAWSFQSTESEWSNICGWYCGCIRCYPWHALVQIQFGTHQVQCQWKTALECGILHFDWHGGHVYGSFAMPLLWKRFWYHMSWDSFMEEFALCCWSLLRHRGTWTRSTWSRLLSSFGDWLQSENGSALGDDTW